MENMKKKMKKMEKINRKKEKVNRRREKLNGREKMKIKKKEDEKLLLRPWDALPSLPLLNIFINLHFKDRFGSIPLVCKAWNSVISDDPRCYSSMIPESVSPEEAFIKKPVVCTIQVRRNRKEIVRDQGVSYLRNFIKKSTTCSSLGGVGGGGSSSSSSTITSLFLDPFHFSNSHTYERLHFSYPDTNERLRPHHDEILRLISQCCPNLKHISFDGFYCASREAVLEVFKSCKKIELIDFSDSGYADPRYDAYKYYVHVIKELGNCLPNLRGIRMSGWKRYSIHDVIATHLPRIELLALNCNSNEDEDFLKLTSETECCLYHLQYLSVAVYPPGPPFCTHFPWNDCSSCYLREVKEEEEKAREKAYLEYYLKMEYSRFDEEYYSLVKQKKECEYYVSISKEKKKKNHPYVVLKSRMRKNKKEASKMKMRKKQDKYDYQDIYVQPPLLSSRL